MEYEMHSQRIRAMEYCKKHSPEYYNRFMREEHEKHIEEIKKERRNRYWGMKLRLKEKE